MPGIISKTGVAENTLQGFAKSLSAAGLSGDELKTAMTAAATAEAAAAGQGAKVIESLKGGKQSVSDLAAEVDKKFGGIVERKMMSLDGLSQQFKANIGKLFGGLNIEPALAGMKTLVGIFDEGSATGQTMKWIFESLFQPLLDIAPQAAQAVEALIIGIMIGALKLYIAFKPAISAVQELIAAFGMGGGDIDWLGSIVEVGKMLAPVLIVAAGLLGLLAVGFAAAAAMAMAVPIAFWAIIGVVGSFLPEIIGFVGKMVSAGGDLIAGLAQGISDGAGAVLSAITGAVGGAINAAKDMLGIKSPSKVFAAIGDNTAQGFAQGMESNQEPLDAMQTMVDPSAAMDASKGSQSSTANTSNTTNNGAPITINITAGGDASAIAEAVRRALRDILSDDAMAMGAA
jgi:hypothetical protein